MRICSIDGCGGKHKGNGLCRSHYDKEKYLKNPKKFIDKSKRYKTNNKDKVDISNQKYRELHPDSNSNFRTKNPDYAKNWEKSHREIIRGYAIKRRYKITTEKYEEVFLLQNGCCRICGTHQSKLDKRLNIDHSHVSGAFRGLLCGNCNRALGMLNDDPAVIRKAALYIEDCIKQEAITNQKQENNYGKSP
jgi:hypothetical protein